MKKNQSPKEVGIYLKQLGKVYLNPKKHLLIDVNDKLAKKENSKQNTQRKLLEKWEMHRMEQLLSKYPILGVFSSVGGSMFPLIETLSPVVQFIGMIVGVFIGIFTLAIKYKEYKNLK